MEPNNKFNTIIIGSGAAGLNCALQLVYRGHDPQKILIITEKLGGGTSFDAGSDKQTYYRLANVGNNEDSPLKMAHTLYDGGAMHGDIALIESTLSSQAFYHLVSLGVPFPHDQYGAFVGYKTDNDPNQRGTSAGPLTSHLMGVNLLKQVENNHIPILDKHYVIDILKDPDSMLPIGVLVLDLNEDQQGKLKIDGFQANFIVIATGGPSGIYQHSVYPQSQWGSSGLALRSGCKFQNLTESQYGLASIKFRWNVSGTYQQVIPRYISLSGELNREEIQIEFLNPYFSSFEHLTNAIFLKGYQWPFNAERIKNQGSSLIDMAVYIETVVKGRRVFLDYLHNPSGFDITQLGAEAKDYLQKSDALQSLPIERLQYMNPKAIELYKSHGIDLWKTPLEIGLCAQHCNGGITGDIWWQTTIPRIFAIGEVNGSHGVHRPGGSALNSGQIGGIRVAEKIIYGGWNEQTSQTEKTNHIFEAKKNEWVQKLIQAQMSTEASDTPDHWDLIRQRLQWRMMKENAYIRNPIAISKSIPTIQAEIESYFTITGYKTTEIHEYLKTYDALITQLAFYYSTYEYSQREGGSRGSYLILDQANGEILDSHLQDYQSRQPNENLKSQILEIKYNQSSSGLFEAEWVSRRPLKAESAWFEQVWKLFDSREIFKK